MANSSFEDMLEQSFQESKEPIAGDIVSGKVIEIDKENVFIHFGGKTEGIIPILEFQEDENTTINKGDKIKVFYLGMEDGDYIFTAKPGLSSLSDEILVNARSKQFPVYGKVLAEIKGGYKVQVGKFSAFCPYSQMDIRKDNPEKYIRNTYAFLVTEFQVKGKNRNIALNRRVLLEVEQDKQIEKLSTILEVGHTVEAKVKSLHNFGAIANVQGLDGLIPLSEVSHHRLKNAGDELQKGDIFPVKILELDWQNKKMVLSRKALLRDTWKDEISFSQGSILKANITSIKAFGIFVKLGAFLEGLVPISETGFAHGTRLETKFEVGQEVNVFVSHIDVAQKRISLSLKKAQETADRQEMEQYMQANNQSDTSAPSSFGDLLKKKLKN